MTTYYHYRTPFGLITIGASASAITHMVFGAVQLSGEFKPTVLTNNASNQIQQYLAGSRRLFDLPLDPEGTPFQKQVWSALELIPYGQTRSYGEVAAAIGKPRSSQAVGQAVGKNPLALLIPCHRVINADGSLGGYAYGQKTKRFLLDLESRGK